VHKQTTEPEIYQGGELLLSSLVRYPGCATYYKQYRKQLEKQKP